MYVWIWRHLPGPRWLRLSQALVLVAAAAFACCAWIFPVLDSLVVGDPDVGTTGQTTSP